MIILYATCFIFSDSDLEDLPYPATSAVRTRHYRSRMTNEQQDVYRIEDRVRKARRVAPSRRSAIMTFEDGEHLVDDNIQQYYCGEMKTICKECGSLNFKNEFAGTNSFNYCCKNGRVKLEPIKISSLIQDLMTGKHQHSTNFMDNID